MLSLLASNTFGGAVLALAGTLATLDPAWSIPANTLLLIIMLVVQRWTHSEVKKAVQNAEHASVAAGAAAQASAAAVDAQVAAAALLPATESVTIHRVVEPGSDG